MPSDSTRQPSRDLAIALRLGLVCFLFFLVFNHGHFKGTDEVGFLQLTRSIFEHGTLAVPRIIHTEVGADGRYYSHFSIGQSVLALPFYALGKLASAVLPEAAVNALAGPSNKQVNQRFGGDVAIFATGLHAPFMSAVLVAIFFLFERALGVSRRTAVATSLLLGATTYVAMMSTYFLRHTSESITVLGGMYGFLRWKQSGDARHLWLGSAFASATLIVRLPAGISGAALASYLAWCVFERGGRRWNPAVIRAALAPVATPLLVVVALSAALDYSRWGVPWNLPQFNTGSLHETPLYSSIYAALLSPGMSVFAYSPLMLLLPWSFPVIWRRWRAEAVTLLALCISFLIAFSSFTGWTGLWSSPGPRYQFISTPLLLLSLGLWIDERWSVGRKLAVGLLGAAGAWIQISLMTVHWGALVKRMGYREFFPKWSFLYLPEHSPILGASNALWSWEIRDNWLLLLSRGWTAQPDQPGQAAHPVAAGVILAAWALLFGAAVWALWRSLYGNAGVSPNSPGSN